MINDENIKRGLGIKIEEIKFSCWGVSFRDDIQNLTRACEEASNHFHLLHVIPGNGGIKQPLIFSLAILSVSTSSSISTIPPREM